VATGASALDSMFWILALSRCARKAAKPPSSNSTPNDAAQSAVKRVVRESDFIAVSSCRLSVLLG